MEKIRTILTTKNIIGWTLGFVIIWFGINEILSPQDWVIFVPSFINSPLLASVLVVAHGALLTISGLSLFLNIYRKISATIVSCMLLEIILNLITASGLSDIAVRDIGLLGATLALFPDFKTVISEQNNISAVQDVFPK